MAIDNIKEDILKDAQQKAASIIKKARQDASHIQKDADRKAEIIRQQAEEQAKKTIDMVKKQEAAKAELEIKKINLEAKKKAIDEAFSQALEKLKKLPQQQKTAFLQKLIKKCEKEFDIATLYCTEEDRKLVTGYKTVAKNIEGGIIAEDGSKTLLVDLSYNALLSHVKDRQLSQISKILFSA